MTKTAGIIVIGSEILSGKTRDENSMFLSQALRDLGVDVRRIAVIPDELAIISDEVRNFSKLYDYVFTTGGVGPTHDDLTMAGIARAFGRGMSRDPQLTETISRHYPSEGLEQNLRMADLPEGARFVGSGLAFPVVVVDNVYIFPGVPAVLQRKFERIKELFRDAPYHLREVYLHADEGKVTLLLHHVLDKFPELLLGSYPYLDNPAYSLKLTLESKDTGYLDAAHAMLVEELSGLQMKPISGEG